MYFKQINENKNIGGLKYLLNVLYVYFIFFIFIKMFKWN